MTIEISPRTERILREALGRGHFQSMDEVIMVSLEAWREQIPNRNDAAAPQNGEGLAREFASWARSRATTPPLSDEAVSHASLNPDRW